MGRKRSDVFIENRQLRDALLEISAIRCEPIEAMRTIARIRLKAIRALQPHTDAKEK